MREGKLTSEFQFAKNAGVWANIALVLGVVIATGSQVLPTVDPNSPIGIVVGGVVAIAGICLKMFTGLGYIKSRTAIKEATAWEAKDEGKKEIGFEDKS